MIYLDHQATTPVDARVLAEMTPYFSELFGNPHSTDHSYGWETSRAVTDAATRVGRLIGADAEEIIFTSGATESNSLALLGLAHRATGGTRRRLLVSAVEHKCVLAVSRAIEERYGFVVEHIPVDSNGFVDFAAFETLLDDDVLVVSVIAVNNEIGTIQDIERLSSLTRDYGTILHCDAAQTPVAVNMSRFAEYADIASLSAHKIYGPKGIGALYIARHLQDRIEPLIYGGGQQNGLRSGTLPTPLCVGMGAAAQMLSGDEFEAERTKLRRRRDEFIDRLKRLTWPIVVNGPEGRNRHPGNANICFTGFCAHDILCALQPSLAASTGSACTSGIPAPSHVLKAIGLSAEDAEASIRFSLGLATSNEDIDTAIDLITGALERLSGTAVAHSA